MAKAKKKVETKRDEEDMFRTTVRIMTFVDLHSLYIFISGDHNRQFGGKLKARELIKARYNIVLAELNRRSYGCNPYQLDTVVIEGDKPEDIDLSKFDKKGNK